MAALVLRSCCKRGHRCYTATQCSAASAPATVNTVQCNAVARLRQVGSSVQTVQCSAVQPPSVALHDWLMLLALGFLGLAGFGCLTSARRAPQVRPGCAVQLVH